MPGQPNTEIWYTATETVEPYNTSAFGANIISNEWDAETGKGVITFDGEVTVIGEKAFYGYKTDCNKLISVTIPDSVTTIETSAFSECSSLECITRGGFSHEFLGADVVKGDFQQRVATHFPHRQHHAPAEGGVGNHLTWL